MDPVSAVASIVTLAALVKDVLETCSKFRRDVRDCPQLLAQFCDEAQTLHILLQRYMSLQCPVTSSTKSNCPTVLQTVLCEVGILKSYTSQLEKLRTELARYDTKRIGSKLLFSLRKKQLEDALDVVHRLKSLLESALGLDNSFCLHTFYVRFERLEGLLLSNGGDFPSSSKGPVPEVPGPACRISQHPRPTLESIDKVALGEAGQCFTQASTQLDDVTLLARYEGDRPALKSVTRKTRTASSNIHNLIFGRLIREVMTLDSRKTDVSTDHRSSITSMVLTLVPSKPFQQRLVRVHISWKPIHQSFQMPSFNLHFADVVPKDHPIMVASARGDCAMLRKIIESRTASPNCCTLEGLTPLHFAAAYGHDDVCRLLLQEGASRSSTSFRGISPLHVAAHFGHVRVFKTLLGAGLDPNDYHENGTNAVFELLSSQRGIGLAEVSGLLSWLLHGQQQHFIDLQAKDSEHRGVISYVRALTAPNDKSNWTSDKIKPPIEVLLDQGARADEPDIHDMSLLHQACYEGDLDLVKMILQRKPDLEVRSQWNPKHEFRDWLKCTPLHTAVDNGYLMIASELIESGAHIDAESESQFLWKSPVSPLKLAARNNNVEMLEMLLANGAGKRDSLLVDALHGAISSDALEAARFLIDDDGRRQIFAHKNIGALVESTEMLEVLSEAGLLAVEEPISKGSDGCYWTHLTYAAYTGDVSMVMSLLNHGANPNKAASPNSPGVEQTPLASAAQEGHLSIAALLLDHGADPTLAGRGSLPPAQLAIASGHGDIASLILKHCHGAVPEVRGAAFTEQEIGTESSVHDTQSSIELDLRRAIDDNNLSKTKWLLEKDSLIRCFYYFGQLVSPLGYAIVREKLPIAEALIEAGVDINVGGDSFNPIMEAARSRNSEFMRLLIKNGAEVNIQTEHGETPLLRCFDTHYVSLKICRNNGETAKMLVKAGAHVNVSDAFGRTPLGGAVQVGNLEAVEILVNAGAYIDQACSINSDAFLYQDKVDGLMLTPLSWAARTGQDQVVQFLLKNGADWRSLKNDPALKYVHRHLMESWFSTRRDDDQSILPALNLFGPVTPKKDAAAAAAGIRKHKKTMSGKDRWCYEQESEEGLLERSLAFLKDISCLLSQHLEMVFAKVHHIRLELIVLISVCIFLLAQQIVQCTSLYKARDFKLLAAVILVSFVLGGWTLQTAG
ncbi:hypothetical protein LTR93_007830 [Exophiala xenobiotica]|nr:hypothetical protein LTR93_007830 [Exophiala xenobiotica]